MLSQSGPLAESVLIVGQKKQERHELVSLVLLSALGKYPRIGEQQIATERIHVRQQPEPVRASLSNWLRVYRDELGVGYHDPMARGKFIFDSENGKKLTSEERERLNLVLRSIEENVPVDIDPEKAEIVFPEFHVSPKAPSAPRPAPSPSFSTVAPPPSGMSDNRPLPVSSPIVQGGVGPMPPRRLPPKPFVPSAPPPVPEGRNDTAVRQPVPTNSSAPVPKAPPQAPARRPVSFVPSPPPDLPVGGTFSFSSPHALPVEATGEGELSIRIPGSPSLPSGQAAFGVGRSTSAPSVSPRDISSDRSGSAASALGRPAPQPAPDLNPFHIHPVGGLGKGKAAEPGAGPTVDLRNDG